MPIILINPRVRGPRQEDPESARATYAVIACLSAGGAKEITKWLRLLSALQKSPSFILSTQVRQLITTYNANSKRSDALFQGYLHV